MAFSASPLHLLHRPVRSYSAFASWHVGHGHSSVGLWPGGHAKATRPQTQRSTAHPSNAPAPLSIIRHPLRPRNSLVQPLDGVIESQLSACAGAVGPLLPKPFGAV